MSQVIDENGNPQTWTAVYWRFHSREREECDSLDEALSFLANGEDNGNLSATEVLGPDGTAVVPESEIFDAMFGYGRWAPEQRDETVRAIGGAR